MIPRLRPEYSLADLARSVLGGRELDLGDLARRCGRASALWTPSGRAGLALALEAAGARRAIVPAFNCWAVMQSLHFARVEPCFVEIGADLNADPDQTLAAISRSGPETALVLTHQFGIPQRESAALVAQAQTRGLPVIEDGAAAFGAVSDAGPVGAVGDLSVLSFQYTKTAICGEGGALLASPPLTAVCERLARRFRRGGVREVFTAFLELAAYRSLTSPIAYRATLYPRVRRAGTTNRRGDEAPAVRFQALPDRFQRRLAGLSARRAPVLLAARRRLAREYLEQLQGLPVEVVPGIAADGAAPIRFPVLVADRAAIVERCESLGLDLGRSFSYTCSESGFPRAERVARSIVNLPLSAALAARGKTIALRFREAVESVH